MMDKILTKKAFPQWVKKLGSNRLYAPQKKDDLWNFELVSDSSSLSLDFPYTVIPPKKILFPQREIFLEFHDDGQEVELKEVLPQEEQVVIFGLRPCEGKAAHLLDKVFGGEFEDTYYWKRRNSSTLIGLACTPPPSANCFCLSVEGSPFSEEGLDILLADLGDKFYVRALTPKGEKLVNESRELFTVPQPEDRKELKKRQEQSEKKISREVINSKNIPAKLKGIFDSSLWDEESMSCIRCGICTYLCPTCHCFDINDEVESSSPLKGKRVRTWDNCQFPDFTMHSSGHNPRPEKASRLRQRLYHKFQYFVEVYKNFQCIGCGRCITSCPVGIDIIRVLDKVDKHG
jgi:ferredoxin